MANTSKKTEETKTAEHAVASHPFLATLLVAPRISEKAAKLGESNKYVFVVTRSANKVELKKAIERAYKVRVTGVNIITNMGKSRNFGQKSGKTSNFKKAVVTLKKGDKIEGMEANI